MHRFLLVIFLSSACSYGSEPTQHFAKGAVVSQLAFRESDKAIIKNRKIIKQGHLEYETPDVNQTRAVILAELSKVRGFVASENVSVRDNQIFQTLNVRVPAEKFDAFIAAISDTVDNFDEKDIQTYDVTEEYVDTEARIRTKKQLEQRYIALLEKANTVKDILAIEKQIGELRSEIEALEGRFRVIQNQVSLSTLTIVTYQSTEVGQLFWSKIKSALESGWNGLIWCIVGLVYIWPVALLCVAIFGLALFLRRRRKKMLPN